MCIRNWGEEYASPCYFGAGDPLDRLPLAGLEEDSGSVPGNRPSGSDLCELTHPQGTGE
jgi:hypothetical protein